MPKGYSGLTLFPFIFLKRKDLAQNRILIYHERIHLRQQLELLIVLFYLFYVIEFMIRYIKLKNWKRAYKSISFEKEAYKNEGNPKFLKERPFWNFIHYF
ncbi:hypothetical protein GCM10011444_00300 [Winogradskyella haliclonae]|uniref:Peptidase M56 domain-containing protein n=1 Tax=Winogradskyella haliclonae TaxID=2048558 RepID=A0ABQ2BTA5_9FLAO|nr:hypothetical protein GCM10011444_00300 [Winogradskyella haliclonae]